MNVFKLQCKANLVVSMHKNVQQEMSIIGSLETFQLYSDSLWERDHFREFTKLLSCVMDAVAGRHSFPKPNECFQVGDSGMWLFWHCLAFMWENSFWLYSSCCLWLDVFFCFVSLETSQRGCPLKMTQHSNGVTFIAKQHFSFDLVLLAVWRYLNWIVLVHTGQESLLSVLSYHQEVFKLTSLGADLHADQQ